MTKSMTAFSRVQANESFGTLVCELRSVNHRFLELHLRLPDELRAQEVSYRETIGKSLNRGKVECFFRLQIQDKTVNTITINKAQAAEVVKASQFINDLLHQPSEVDPLKVLTWPGVLEEEKLDLKPVIACAENLLQQALDDLIVGREREGARMAEVIQQRCNSVQTIVDQTRSHMPLIQQRYREKLLAKLDALKTDIDSDRMEQELLHLVQKMDVEEEIDRLDSHLKEMKDILSREDAVGRRLDFLMQELNREANTLGSKSSDITSTQASVELKVLIEQMREQIQNLE